MYSRKLSILLVMLIIVSMFLTACGPIENNTINNKKTGKGSVYVNEEYGFYIEFPESWEGGYEIKPDDNGLIISSEVNNITTLAYIHKYTTQEWEELNNGEDLPIEYQILGEDTAAVFVLIFPGDVNYDVGNEKSVQRYEEMVFDLKTENFTFGLIK